MKTAEEYFKENKIHRKLVASDFVITERHLGKIITEDRQQIVDKIKDMIDDVDEKMKTSFMDGVNYAIDKSKPIIESLLKKQRENCAEEFNKLFKKRTSKLKDYPNAIRNAPEPEGGSE